MARPNFQIAVDAADPHTRSGFWTAAGYEVEDHHDQIEQRVAIPTVSDPYRCSRIFRTAIVTSKSR